MTSKDGTRPIVQPGNADIDRASRVSSDVEINICSTCVGDGFFCSIKQRAETAGISIMGCDYYRRNICLDCGRVVSCPDGSLATEFCNKFVSHEIMRRATE